MNKKLDIHKEQQGVFHEKIPLAYFTLVGFFNITLCVALQ